MGRPAACAQHGTADDEGRLHDVDTDVEHESHQLPRAAQRPGGRAQRGHQHGHGEGDQGALERAARQLRAEVESVQAIDLPGERGVRHALRLRPLAPCPAAYPRPVGVALKAPLGSDPPRGDGDLSRSEGVAPPRRRAAPADGAADPG